MYHYDVTYGQLAWMLVLALICYQFTIVGESVYLDAIRAFDTQFIAFGEVAIVFASRRAA